MSLCKHCVSGVTHEGTPAGKFEEIGGVRCYVATPTVDYPKDKVVLFLTDVFGIDLINSQLLTDDFARNGFKTIIPDYLNGDSIPAEAMVVGPQANFDLQKWFTKHGPEYTRPPLDKVIAALKEQGVKSFGATGYCLGARYVFDLAFDGVISASVISHPTLLTPPLEENVRTQIPADLEKYASSAKAPLLINSCTVDVMFPAESRAKADEILGGGKFAPGYKQAYWEGCTHGFAVRGDLSDLKTKEGKEGAFRESVEWFIRYL